METGKIEIQFKENTSKLSVHIQLSEDGTVWLTKHQIADLFDVYIQTVTAGLKTIQRNGLLKDDTVRIHRHLNTQGTPCSVDLYNLATIITLSYYMQGGICDLFRNWLHKQAIALPSVITLPKQPIIIQLNRTELL